MKEVQFYFWKIPALSTQTTDQGGCAASPGLLDAIIPFFDSNEQSQNLCFLELLALLFR